MRKIGIVIAAAALLAGCAQKLPQDKLPYAGTWRSEDTRLRITADGQLEYEHQDGAIKKSVDMPVQEISDGKIIAGVWFLKTTFVVSQPPTEEDGDWSMVIDGRKLVKDDADGRPRSRVVPALPKLRKLVTADLRLLGKALQRNDFGDYLANASLTYQSQFSNEKLKAAYREIVDAKLDLEAFMGGDFALAGEPSISEEGVLVVEGRYPPAEGSALMFRASYVFNQAEWKPFGMRLQFASEQPAPAPGASSEP